MNFFGEGEKKEFSPKCPDCGCRFTFEIAEGKDWTEYRCSKCHRVFAVIDGKIKLLGWS